MSALAQAWATLWTGVDWFTASLLAGVVLLEGLRRVPQGALVLRATPAGRWGPVPVDPGLRIVSWFAPATIAVILPNDSALVEPDRAAFAERLRRIRPFLLLLTALSWMSLLGLVLGLSLAAAHFGGWGFLFGAGGLLLLAMLMSGLTAWGLQRSGMPARAALRASLKLLSPFASGRAIEVLVEGAARGLPPLVVARALMSSAAFSGWVRPRVFDAEQGERDDAELGLAMTEGERSSLLESAPESALGGATFCRRCGHTFDRETGTCPDCGVSLVRRLPSG